MTSTSRSLSASFGVAAITLLTCPLSAVAACHNGVCATGVEKNGWLRITLSSKSHPFTHFNFRNLSSGGSNQEEYPAGRPRIDVYVGREGDDSRSVRFRYAVQVCNRGGTFQRSSCRPWATFVHNVQGYSRGR